MATTGGADIEELVKRVAMHDHVEGFLIINSEGLCVRHSFTEASRPLAVQYASLLQNLSLKVNSVLHELENNNNNFNNNNASGLSGSNELQFIRLRTKKDEIIIAPDNKYLLVVIQKPPGYGEEKVE
ncbi:dynein light chain roadblock-type [Angomonas deanei]|uniref:Roadblock/LC7 domain containing protein, putative n=1 Tax=Angomonas deanei TaxID=59799 RepID=S9UJX9_9TRYP|nr:dynein light chain roadblock-type [Angomonas deanei]EPY38777.1 dynein light chain roadblock-type [Angomonas deanei]CAD2222296.1 Roadblock/LC7 domain containing protein, putative [Angomonas deanei]|eukprot:EPY31092.1 dynein light chain roadblock-type [Angomonas deanei]